MPAKKKTSKAKKTATAAPKAKKAAKATAKKAAAKKAPVAAKKATAKKAPAAAKKAAAKKAPAAAKKAAAKKAPAAAKKAAAKKAPAAVEQTAIEHAPAAAKKTAAKKAPAAAKKSAKKAPVAIEPTAIEQASTAAEKTAAEQAPAGDYDAAIARIEAKAAAAGVELAKGANAKAIKAAEKALGLALPEEVVAFYRRHDGAETDAAVEGRELLSLSRIVDEWKIWKDLLDQGTFEANDHSRPDPGVQKRWWIPEWVPVTYDGAGNHHVLDLAPAPGGTHGQILSFWHDDDERTLVAKSFLGWLEGAAWGDAEGGDRDDASDDAAANDGGDDESDDEDDEDESDEAAGDFRRFEMEQKFWSIRLDGDSYIVRFGKLGTDGQEQVKSFDDEATAKKEHDKLVAAKVKKGYREV